MRYLKIYKLFESLSDATYQKAQDLLDDVFTEFMDEWGFTEGDGSKVIDEPKYHYDIHKGDKKVQLIFSVNTAEMVGLLNRREFDERPDMDFRTHAYSLFKKIKDVYKRSTFTSNITIDPDTFEPYFILTITVNI